MAQTYYSPISINAAQVPSTQSDFPVLVSQTDNRFKTTGNGGHVASSSGFDIRPYTDSTLSTAITGYELERYNASSGEVIMWVKVASLSSSTTPIYLGYGDTSLTTDGSSTTTWSNGFTGVYHFKDGTTIDVNSATGANNGTNHGATASTGQIDGCASFVSASTQYVDVGNAQNTGSLTYSAWIKATSFPNAYNGVIVRARNTDNSALFVKSTGKLACFVVTVGQQSYDGTGANTLSTGTWYYLAFVWSDSTAGVGYVNASIDATFGSAVAAAASVTAMDIGQDPFTAGRTWDGLIDEARVASVARSADWITTEYNNQSSLGTFETLGTEVQFQPISGLYRL